MSIQIPLNIEQSFQQAIACHQAGALQDAERLYLAVLQTRPNHADANFNMGLLQVQQGQPITSLPYFTEALEADPACAQYWLSYVDALFQAGQKKEAMQVLDMAKQQGLAGREVDALAQRLGANQVAADLPHRPINVPNGNFPEDREINALTSLFAKGDHMETAAVAKAMTERFPEHGFAWKVLGMVLKQMGRTEAALLPMQKSVALSPHDAQVHGNLAVTLMELGRPDEAEISYRRALHVNPNYAQAHCNLGALLLHRKRQDEAEVCFRRALRIKPDYADAYNNLGNVLGDAGKFDEAEACYRQVLQINPNYVQAHFNLGVALDALERQDESLASYLNAIHIKPDYAEAHGNLGFILQRLGRLDEAEASYRQALRIKPDYAEVHGNLGTTLKALGRLDEAEACYRQALQIKPDYVEGHGNLGLVLHECKKRDEAEACYRRALQIRSDYVEGHCNLGLLLCEQGRLPEAEASCRRAVQIKPDLVEAHGNLGNALFGMGQLGEAEISYRRALEIRPDYAEVLCNLGNTLQGLGWLVDAVRCYRQALQIKPDFADAHSNLIFTLDLMEDVSPAQLYEERERWGALHAAHLRQQRSFRNIPDPERRLRIAYVSGDFRVHSAAYAFGAMLVDFDPKQFDVIAYSNSTIEDVLTQDFKQSVSRWRNIFGLSDDAVADMIREDGVDILVDLSGHMAGNRLLVFARKPAPIQITAWGYAAGTGMAAMDYLFVDPVVVPFDEKKFYVEQVRYLPSLISSFQKHGYPAVNALPALSGKGITFGSFNRLVKNSDATYEVWARILLAIPGSRMIIKTQTLSDEAVCEQVRFRFTRLGVEAARVVLLGRTPRDEHMAVYNHIDIALDPFPHGGGVTALEGLAMGVPLVTLRWPTLTGRVSASIMTSMGLTDWIAETQDQYVYLAVQKAGDLQSLAELRNQLPEIFRASVIGDQKSYVRAAEQEYRLLWRKWCAGHS